MLDRGPGTTAEGPPNYSVNPPVGPVTRLACGRRVPNLPAGYAERWADRRMRFAAEPAYR
jgi:hypothetical protein